MNRAEFVKTLAIMPLIRPVYRLNDFLSFSSSLKYADAPLPAVFVGHGSPNNAFKQNAFTTQLHEIGKSLPFVPSAVLVVSAHYLSQEQSLLKVRPHFDNTYYSVKGALDYQNIITGSGQILTDDTTELDHGAWAILRHIFPDKNVPVMELSIPMNVSLSYHAALAQELKKLRYKGVLIIGSGNVVHNLQLSGLKMLTLSHKPYSWALEMDDWVKKNIDERNLYNLFNYVSMGKAARMAINTADHYIPMLYTLSMTDSNEEIKHTYEEVFSGISMRCFKTV